MIPIVKVELARIVINASQRVITMLDLHLLKPKALSGKFPPPPHLICLFLLLVHFLVHDNRLSDAETPAGALLVDVARHVRRLNPSLEASVSAARGGNVRALLVLLMGPLRL